MRSGASATPEQEFPREPTISTTERAIASGGAPAPPTIAAAGKNEISRNARASARRISAHEPIAHAIVNGKSTMPSILLSGPAVEPVTLAQAKQFIRVEHDDDDDIITALIAGSRIHVETQSRRALITQSWRLVRDVWPELGWVPVLPVPLRTLDAARVYHSDGSTLAVDVAALAVDKAAAPARLSFTRGALPIPERRGAGIGSEL